MITIIILLIIYIFNLILLTIYCRIRKDKMKSNGDFKKKSDGYTGLAIRIYSFIEGLMKYNLFIVGRMPSHIIRNFLYRHIFMVNMNKNVIIYGGAEFRAPWNIYIGQNTIIGDDAKLDGRYGIEIGSNVNFSTGVWIWTNQHSVNDSNFSCENQGKKVSIGDRAWISCRTILLPGVNIGEGCVVAAGSVVSKDCDSFSIYAGIPAKKIGERNNKLEYQFDGSRLWFC